MKETSERDSPNSYHYYRNVTVSDYFQSGKNFMAKQRGYYFTLENGVLKSYRSLSGESATEVPVSIVRKVSQPIGRATY